MDDAGATPDRAAELHPIERVLEYIFAGLEQPELEPNRARIDWGRGIPRLKELRARFATDVLARVAPDAAAPVGVADVAAALGAASWASRDEASARQLFERAAALAGPGAAHDGFAAATRDPAGFTRLAWAQWLERRGHMMRGLTIRTELARATREAALRQAALPEGDERFAEARAHASVDRGHGALKIVAMVTVGLVAMVTIYALYQPSSPSMRRRVQAAQAAEKRGDSDGALREYEAVLADSESMPTTRVNPRWLAEAGAGITRILLARVPEPYSAASLPAASAVVTRFRELPEHAQVTGTADLIGTATLRWSDAVGTADLDALITVRRTFALAGGLPVSAELSATISARSARAGRALATRLAADEPLLAFELLVGLAVAAPADPAAPAEIAEAGVLLERFEAQPSALRAWKAPVEAWLRRAVEPAGLTPRIQGVRKALDAAVALDEDATRLALLESEDQTALRSAVAASPADQQLAARLALVLAEAGDSDGALRVLEALAPPGLLVLPVREQLARLLADADQLDRAGALLATYLKLHSERDELGWVEAQLTYGDITMRRAVAASGDERTRLLADAEAALFAIGNEEGSEPATAYRVRLAEVYHRLGRTDESRQVYAALIALDDPELLLTIARSYRGLALDDEAKALLERLWARETIPQEHRIEAAALLAILTEGAEEEEQWLERSSTQLVSRMNLLELQAERLEVQGDLDGAASKYREVIAGYADSMDDSSVVNNTALALDALTEVTGDPSHLDRAIAMLAAEVAARPLDTVETDNLAHLYLNAAKRRVVGRFVDLRTARLSTAQISTLYARILDSALRGEAVAVLRQDRSHRRYVELLRRVQRLAPQSTRAYLGELRANDALGDLVAQRALLARATTTFGEPAPFDTSLLPGPLGPLPAPVATPAPPRPSGKAAPAHDPLFLRLGNEASPRTLAAAWYLHGVVLGEDDEATLQDTVDAFVEAHALWPELGALDDAGWHMVSGGLQRAVDDDKWLKERWDDSPDVPSDLAYMPLLQSADGPRARAALVGTTQLVLGISLELGQRHRQARLGDVVFAWLLGDRAALTRGLASLRSERWLLYWRTIRVLDRADLGTPFVLAWLDRYPTPADALRVPDRSVPPGNPPGDTLHIPKP